MRNDASGEMPRARTGDVMKAIKSLISKLVKDEQGGEVLEYALIAGLIVVAAISIIGAVGTKVVARWTSLNASM
jgi:pilus assembly protein Flp/PilA